MSLQTWQETLVCAVQAGANLSSFSTSQSILPQEAKFTLPANWWQVGRVMRIKAAGQLTHLASATMVFEVKLGSVVAFSSGTINLSGTAHTASALPFLLEILVTCRVVGQGTTSKLIGQGIITSQCVVNVATTTDAVNNTLPTLLLPNIAPVVPGSGWDSTAALALDLFAGFGASSASNSIQLHQYVAESLN